MIKKLFKKLTLQQQLYFYKIYCKDNKLKDNDIKSLNRYLSEISEAK